MSHISKSETSTFSNNEKQLKEASFDEKDSVLIASTSKLALDTASCSTPSNKEPALMDHILDNAIHYTMVDEEDAEVEDHQDDYQPAHSMKESTQKSHALDDIIQSGVQKFATHKEHPDTDVYNNSCDTEAVDEPDESLETLGFKLFKIPPVKNIEEEKNDKQPKIKGYASSSQASRGLLRNSKVICKFTKFSDDICNYVTVNCGRLAFSKESKYLKQKRFRKLEQFLKPHTEERRVLLLLNKKIKLGSTKYSAEEVKVAKQIVDAMPFYYEHEGIMNRKEEHPKMQRSNYGTFLLKHEMSRLNKRHSKCFYIIYN